MVQRLKLRAPSAGGPGSIPGQGTRSHMLQLRPREAKYTQKLNRENTQRELEKLEIKM